MNYDQPTNSTETISSKYEFVLSDAQRESLDDDDKKHNAHPHAPHPSSHDQQHSGLKQKHQQPPEFMKEPMVGAMPTPVPEKMRGIIAQLDVELKRIHAECYGQPEKLEMMVNQCLDDHQRLAKDAGFDVEIPDRKGFLKPPPQLLTEKKIDAIDPPSKPVAMKVEKILDSNTAIASTLNQGALGVKGTRYAIDLNAHQAIGQVNVGDEITVMKSGISLGNQITAQANRKSTSQNNGGPKR